MVTTVRTALSLGTLTSGYVPPADADVVVFRIPFLRPRRLFTFSVAVFGPLSGATVRNAVVDQLGARLIAGLTRVSAAEWALRQTVRAASIARRLGHKLAPKRGAAGEPLRTVRSREARPVEGGAAAIIAAASAEVARLSLPTVERVAQSEARHEIGDAYARWDAVFQDEDPFHYDTPYEQLKYARTLDMIPEDGRIERVLELGCAEGHFTRMLAPRVPHLRALDISSIALERARGRCTGLKNIEYVCSDFFKEPIEGTWDLILCAEVLYYMDSKEQLAAFAKRLAESLTIGGYFIHVHPYLVTDDPSHTGFDWDDPFGAQTILQTFRAVEGLVHVKGLSTDLNRIDLFKRCAPGRLEEACREDTVVPLTSALEPSVAAQVVWNGAIKTRRDVGATERAAKFPVLMYHRVANDGPQALSQWRVTPEALEHQLRFLRRRGFRSVTLAEWRAHSTRGAMRGRPVLLTFDDAYLDFYETAWPILQRNGFSALVFVPTGHVGRRADWDAGYGDPAPLMRWEQIAALAAAGCSFGSHLVSHSPADGLSSKELLREAALSRAALERVVGGEIRSVAPPYGAIDARTEQICATAGYDQIFLVNTGLASVAMPRPLVPRIEVSGSDDIAAFAAKVGVAHEPPEDADLP